MYNIYNNYNMMRRVINYTKILKVGVFVPTTILCIPPAYEYGNEISKLWLKSCVFPLIVVHNYYLKLLYKKDILGFTSYCNYSCDVSNYYLKMHYDYNHTMALFM